MGIYIQSIAPASDGLSEQLLSPAAKKSFKKDEMADSQAVTFQRRILTGGCHCNAFVYEIEGPAITTAVDCNCSICSRKGYLWHFTGKDDKFTIVRGAESDLTEYKFGAGELVHMVRHPRH